MFTDKRFGLAEGDRPLLRFLVEMLHPDVRHDLGEVHDLLAFFNIDLAVDGYEIVQVDAISGAPIFDWQRIGQGVRGTMKNLIFAAVGPKPEIVLADAVNNDLRIVRHEEHCLVYDRPLSADGLTWRDLTTWWAARDGTMEAPTVEVERSLYRRLQQSLDGNGAELRVLSAYAERYVRLGPDIPALIPQVYLHYDPYNRSRHPAPARVLHPRRMDFLLLLPHRVRVVIECDGKQHYAHDDGRVAPDRYAAYATALRANTTALRDNTGDRLLTPDAHEVLFTAATSLGNAGLVRPAITAYQQLLTDCLRVLGPDHPDTLTARGSLASRRAEAGDLAGAIDAYQQLLTDYLRALGPDHPDTLTARNNLAYWRAQAGDPVGAASATEELLADRLRVNGPDHPHTLVTQNNLAYWRGQAGDPAGAATAFKQLLIDSLRVLGPDHPHTLTGRHHLAHWRGQAGDPAGAARASETLQAVSRDTSADIEMTDEH
ncbi:tetratricopeptide repeat protein [Dactylosporangium sp. CA-092794]|uniref:AbiJ-related protein n=1 Tax=Dactylosporangium sp. CA-092794 TaxID=3239929 RepID=UPI003D8A5556